MPDLYREYCCKQHRVIAHYLAIQAWHRNLDCIVLEREDLEILLDLERFKQARLDWFWVDVAPWFPHHQDFYSTSGARPIHSVWLSRVSLDDLAKGRMASKARIHEASSKGIRASLLQETKHQKVPKLNEIVAYLAILADGLGVPGSRYNIDAI